MIQPQKKAVNFCQAVLLPGVIPVSVLSWTLLTLIIEMDNFHYETCLQEIMVVVFIIFGHIIRSHPYSLPAGISHRGQVHLLFVKSVSSLYQALRGLILFKLSGKGFKQRESVITVPSVRDLFDITKEENMHKRYVSFERCSLQYVVCWGSHYLNWKNPENKYYKTSYSSWILGLPLS